MLTIAAGILIAAVPIAVVVAGIAYATIGETESGPGMTTAAVGILIGVGVIFLAWSTSNGVNPIDWLSSN